MKDISYERATITISYNHRNPRLFRHEGIHFSKAVYIFYNEDNAGEELKRCLSIPSLIVTEVYYHSDLSISTVPIRANVRISIFFSSIWSDSM